MNTVLMTHILAEGSMGMADIANEALLLFVGTGVGVVLNLYIPGSETAIRSAQGEIEETFIRPAEPDGIRAGNTGREWGAAGRPRVSGPGTGHWGRHWSRANAEPTRGWRTVFWRTHAIILPIWG